MIANAEAVTSFVEAGITIFGVSTPFAVLYVRSVGKEISDLRDAFNDMNSRLSRIEGALRALSIGNGG